MSVCVQRRKTCWWPYLGHHMLSPTCAWVWSEGLFDELCCYSCCILAQEVSYSRVSSLPKWKDRAMKTRMLKARVMEEGRYLKNTMLYMKKKEIERNIRIVKHTSFSSCA